ncbi:M23 family metallopeptidase [Edaphobacter albus]|uniref:M23 family metallopeptidase n=1 Tax=Edaphobacter sp. 4G125 TaxID=2763071 RepID=UPI0016466AC2|nr:M23 family metallopeptidase [Edaphobacter sp. 4G125]QNI35643.1 M23 family metallopeptidase [Edaphobacter sp. 4G125]
MNALSRTLQFAAFFLLYLSFALSQQPVSVSWTPETLVNGSPCLFAIKARQATSITGNWQGHSLEFFKAKDKPDTWYALAGVDVGTKSGNYDLTVEMIQGDSSQTIHRTISVTPAPYKEIPLTVPEKYVKPDTTAQQKIAADQEIKNKAFAGSEDYPVWIGRFSPPLHSAPRTDSFGTRRLFNGSLASIHRGLDYRAKTGTPVMATNNGRVVLARSLYYEGNCVIIDHGLGLMTLYMHLSKFKVKEGQRVKRGQIIALSGGTGRATGTHLHLSVRWHGEYLDPARLFALSLPTLKDTPSSMLHP